MKDTILTQEEKDRTLKNFMEEFFPFSEFKKIGFFTAEMKGDFKAQAERVCKYFGYETVYEYGAKTIDCVHLSGVDKKDSFTGSISSIYN